MTNTKRYWRQRKTGTNKCHGSRNF